MSVTMHQPPVETTTGGPGAYERHAHAQPFAATTGTRAVSSSASVLMGWALVETTGTASASVDVFDGSDNTGSYVATITLNPGQSVRDWFAEGGLELERGCAFVVTSGSVKGAAFMRYGVG